eukprot:COSAG02_NODE_1013_length_15207_cov_4.700556_7_plen_80_part_00
MCRTGGVLRKLKLMARLCEGALALPGYERGATKVFLDHGAGELPHVFAHGAVVPCDEGGERLLSPPAPVHHPVVREWLE